MSTIRLPADNAGLPTFAEAKGDRGLKTISQVCNNSDDFKSLLNEATKRLMDRGDWPGTEKPILLTVQNGVVTFPRIVGAVRALNICNRDIPIYGEWFRFLPHQWSRGSCCGTWRSWCGQRPVMTEYGMGVQFADIPTDFCVLKVTGVPQDDGAIIQFFGTNPQGESLVTTDVTTITDGISITINQPFTVGSDVVKHIDRVIKPVTQGPVSVSAVDTVSGQETPIARFDASDTNPSFSQYRLAISQCVNTSPVFQAIALVKLKFIPVIVDTDIVLIPNLFALKLFMQGIRFGEAGDRNNALLYQADSVKELNLEMDNLLPVDQIPVDVNAFGTAQPWKSGIGRIL